MGGLVTMREVAAQAGVSLKTVSRVFNDDPHVRADLRQRVQQALADSNYVRNDLAQTFRSGRGRVIGVAVPNLLDPFFAAVVAAIDAEATRRGYATLVTATGFDPATEQENVTSLLNRQLAGLVLAPVSPDQAHLDLASRSVPVVFVDQPAHGVPVDSFVHDDRGGATLATGHLLGHGFRRIGFLGRAPHLATSRERLAGYRLALAGEADDALVIADVDTPADGYAELRRQGADAIFTADPRTTIACIPELRSDPVAVLGFGDFPLADLLTPSISVIDQDAVTMGTDAARHLFEQLDGPAERRAEVLVLPVRLVERESCRIGG